MERKQDMIQIKVPDLGGASSVDVIEILVQEGDVLIKDQSVVVLESDKATMELPSSQAGKVARIYVKVGSKVQEGDVILDLTADEGVEAVISDAVDVSVGSSETQTGDASPKEKQQPYAPPGSGERPVDHRIQVLVLGGGPGGYTAAFRSADLGFQVMLVEKYPVLGGVCLNVGCIPSKALLHSARVITETQEMVEHGVRFGIPEIDVDALRGFKEKVVDRLNQGLTSLAKQRKVDVICGVANFLDAHHVEVVRSDGRVLCIRFEHAVIAVGSHVFKIPNCPYEDPRIMDSTDALALRSIPKKMLIVGGGIIGLEMATVYGALGSEITVIELGDSLIPGCDHDLVRVLQKKLEKRGVHVHLSAQVEQIKARDDAVWVSWSNQMPQPFDAVLIAAGRRPNGARICAELAGVEVDERGFILVDSQCRTQTTHIFAIGDVIGQPMLAHKATCEAKIVAENIAGLKRHQDALTIPSVAYTDPEIAWMGLTELEAKATNKDVEIAKFPWAASGRALGHAREEGLTKLIVDRSTQRILGAGIVGLNAGELIAEAALALEMGADVHDLALTIHPHPTLSESLAFSAEMINGSITDLYIPKKI